VTIRQRFGITQLVGGSFLNPRHASRLERLIIRLH
jgi:hypothetical protein